MSEEIIIAVIGAGAALLAAVIPIIFAKRTHRQKKKDMLPQPFSAAWCDKELVCKDLVVANDHSAKLVFDMSKGPQTQVMPFVSIVYAFPEETSLAKTKVLRFTLDFDTRFFERVDLEIKNTNGEKTWTRSYKPQKDYELNLKQEFGNEFSELIDSVKEICFVVKRKNIKNSSLKGELKVYNISLRKK